MARKIARRTKRTKARKNPARSEIRPRAAPDLGEVMAIMARLRGKAGCPWDREQTHVSLKPALLEETYELLDAIERGDPNDLEEELADLLLQVVFHSQIAAEDKHFTLLDVICRLKEKLVRRHPHVFAAEPLADADAVLRQRTVIKAKEKHSPNNAPGHSLGDLPKAMPALARAQRIAERASYVGFDWRQIGPVWDKVDEELRELKSAASSGDRLRLRDEVGDLLFASVNLARFLRLEAEDALASATERFLKRFAHLESRLREQGKTPPEASLEEMDALWEEAKGLERRG